MDELLAGQGVMAISGRYVNPLVEGSSPSPVIPDRTGQMLKRPKNPGLTPQRTGMNPIRLAAACGTLHPRQRLPNPPKNTPQLQYICHTDSEHAHQGYPPTLRLSSTPGMASPPRDAKPSFPSCVHQ